MVSITQSLAVVWGNWLAVPGTGIFLNNFMNSFPRGTYAFPGRDHPNFIAGWKRPRNTHCPTIITKNGNPFMTIGSPSGRRQHGACVQAIIHVIDHGMSIQKAISAPRLHCEGNIVWIESRVADDTREKLAKIGHEVISTPNYYMFFGGLAGILLDEKGRLHGGADPRRVYTAIGYN